jgi:CDP-diacylglycerol--glycerol-3-phosphate 3-phosphatidyltransferase
MKLADKFTLVRLLLAPVLFLILFIPLWTGKFAFLSVIIFVPLFIFAEFTDFLDGYYARKNNEVSDFGKLFDPFADVMLHMSMFVYCLIRGYMPSVCFLLIFYREFCQIFLRMLAVKKGVSVGARKGGKFKTVLYVLTVGYTLILDLLPRLNINIADNFPVLRTISTIFFILSAIAALASFVDYLVNFKKILAKN